MLWAPSSTLNCASDIGDPPLIGSTRFARTRTAKPSQAWKNWIQFCASDSNRQMVSRRPHDTLTRLPANNGRASNQQTKEKRHNYWRYEPLTQIKSFRAGHTDRPSLVAG